MSSIKRKRRKRARRAKVYALSDKRRDSRRKRSRKAKAYDPKRLVIAAIRKTWFWSPARRVVLKGAERWGGKYECAKCAKTFDKKSVQVDHVEPVIPTTGWEGFESYFQRTFYGPLQVLCKSCHLVKSNKENASRRKKEK